ncbi:adenylyltransferase/cytidyltransferase family protein [Paucibacter soli]|uniref:adenylyltransferase/cytidyltransferase family protein n=1 Tax=Paucibacter soli TaxID=3133433 RepID=UPI0030A9AE16
MKPSRTTAVVIGRMQLLHWAHCHLIQSAFKIADQVVIAIGSSWRSRNPKNPLTFLERKEMILRTLSPEQQSRVRFVGVRDVYDSPRWVSMVRTRVEAHCEPGEQITLVGHSKDASSSYLAQFPGWGYIDAGSPLAVDSTALRDILFGRGLAPAAAFAEMAPFMHDGILDYLASWTRDPVYAERCAEHMANEAYKKKYPGPVYKTGDAIIEAAGHVLMGERGGALGFGTLAFLGGHTEDGESGVDTAIREAFEESTLAKFLTPEQLRASIVGQREFNAPGRSPRGRIETTACYFKLEGYTRDTLPQLFGRDDVKPKPLLWLSHSDFSANMHRMFDDHDCIGEGLFGAMHPLVELQAT